MASRAVVTSLLGCVVLNTRIDGHFYYLVGAADSLTRAARWYGRAVSSGLVLEKASFRYGELWVLLETSRPCRAAGWQS